MPKKYSLTKQRNKLWRAMFPGLLLILLLLGGLLLFAPYLKKSQDVRQQAAGNDKQVVFSVRSGSPDDTHLKIDVFLNTHGYQLAAVDLRGSLNDISSQNVQIISSNYYALNIINSQLNQSNQTTNFRLVAFAPLSASAQTSSHDQDQVLISFLITNPTNKRTTIHFDLANSFVSVLNVQNLAVQYPADSTLVLQTQTDIENAKKACNQNCATDTECKSGMQCYKGLCRRQPNLEDVACGLQVDQGIHRSCNEYCADSTECSSKYICYYNHCRNPQNLNNTACAAAVAAKKPTIVKTGTVQITAKPEPTPKLKTGADSLNLPVGAKIVAIDNQPIATASASPTVAPTMSPLISYSPSPSPRIVTPSPQPVVAVATPKSNLPSIILVIGGGLLAIGVIIFAYRKMNQ